MKRLKRINLVEFQQRLTSNLEAARNDKGVNSIIAFKCGGENWLIRLVDLKEIEGVPSQNSIRKIGLTKPWMMGISNFKGTIYTLIDFQQFLGLATTNLGLNSRVILFHPKFGLQSGIIVPEVLGLFDVNQSKKIKKTSSDEDWVMEKYENQEGLSWKLIDVNLLVNSREMIDINLR